MGPIFWLPPLHLTEEDSGTSVHVAMGEIFKIQLRQTSASSPQSFMWVRVGGDAVRLYAIDAEGIFRNLPTYHFKCIAEGESEITLSSGGFTNKKMTFRIIVDPVL
ncbi:MAG TPA: hypothetical protein V6D17_11740 [Candidatus Obscuribacterales bacterium]